MCGDSLMIIMRFWFLTIHDVILNKYSNYESIYLKFLSL